MDKKTASLVDISTSGRTVKNEIISNKELAKELRKPIIRTIEKRKVHNIWSTGLGDIQLISKFNEGFIFYCVLLIFIANMHGLFL